MNKKVPITFKRLLSLLLVILMLTAQFGGAAGALASGSDELAGDQAREAVSVSSAAQDTAVTEAQEDEAPAEQEQSGDTPAEPENTGDQPEETAAPAEGEDASPSSASATDAGDASDDAESGEESDADGASGEPSDEAAAGDAAAEEEMNILSPDTDGASDTYNSSYSFTLNANGGEFISSGRKGLRQVTISNNGYYYVQLYTDVANSDLCRRNGYAFMGYFTEDGTMVYDQNGKFMLPLDHKDAPTTDERNIDYELPGNVTLYAHWAIVTSLDATFDTGYDGPYRFVEKNVTTNEETGEQTVTNEKVTTYKSWETNYAIGIPCRSVDILELQAVTPDPMPLNEGLGTWARDEMQLVIKDVVGPEGYTKPDAPLTTLSLTEEYHYTVTFTLVAGPWKCQNYNEQTGKWEDVTITVPIYIDRTAPAITWTYTDGKELAPGEFGARITPASDPDVNDGTTFWNSRAGYKVTFTIMDQSLSPFFIDGSDQHFTLVDTQDTNPETKYHTLATQAGRWETFHDANGLVTGYRYTFDLDVPAELNNGANDESFTFDGENKLSRLYYIEFNREGAYFDGLAANGTHTVADEAGNRSDPDLGETTWMRSDKSGFDVLISPSASGYYHPADPSLSHYRVYDGAPAMGSTERRGIECKLTVKNSALSASTTADTYYGRWLTLKVDGEVVELPTFTQNPDPDKTEEWNATYTIMPAPGQVNKVHTIELTMKDPDSANADAPSDMWDNLVLDDAPPTLTFTTDPVADLSQKFSDYPEVTVTVRDLSPDVARDADGNITETDAEGKLLDEPPAAGVLYDLEEEVYTGKPYAPLLYVVSDPGYDVTALSCNGTPLELDETASHLASYTVSKPMLMDVVDGEVQKTLKFTASATFRGTIHFIASDQFKHTLHDEMEVYYSNGNFYNSNTDVLDPGTYVRIVIDSVPPEARIVDGPDGNIATGATGNSITDAIAITGLPGYTNGGISYDVRGNASYDQGVVIGYWFRVWDNSIGYPADDITLTYTKDGGEEQAFTIGTTSLYSYIPWEGYEGDIGDQFLDSAQSNETTSVWTTPFAPSLTLFAADDHSNDGTYVVKISAKDDVGNTDPEKSVKTADPIVIDTIVPQVSISQPVYTDGRALVPEKDGNVYVNAAVKYELRIADRNIDPSDFLVTGSSPFQAVTVSIDGSSDQGGDDFRYDAGDARYSLSDWTLEDTRLDGTKVWLATLTVQPFGDGKQHTVVVGLEARDKAYNTSVGSISEADTEFVSTAKNDVAWGAFSDRALVSSKLIFDSTAPTIKIDRPVQYTGVDSANGTTNYYSNVASGSGRMEVTVTVTDDSIVWNGSTFTCGDIKITVYDKNGQAALPANFEIGKEWKQDFQSPVLTNTVKFNAPTDQSVEYYIHVEARDGTAQKLPSADASDKGNTTTLDSTAEAAVDGKKYGYIILDTTKPVVTYAASDYFGSGKYGEDWYSDTSGAKQSPTPSDANDSIYNIYSHDGNRDLHVTVTVTDDHISMSDTVTESAKVKTADRFRVYRFDTLEAAQNFTGTGGTRVTQGTDYRFGSWSSSNNGEVWKNTLTITAQAKQGYYVVVGSWRDKAANDGPEAHSAAHVLVNDLTCPAISSVVSDETNETAQPAVYQGKNAYYTNDPGEEGGLNVTFTMSDNNYIDTSAGSSAFSFTVYQYSTSGTRGGGYSQGYGSIVGDGAWTEEDGKYTITYHLTTKTDGIYTVALTVRDLAGNVTVHESDYLVVDTEAPNGTIASRGASGEEKWSTDPWKTFLSAITFGLFSNDSITTTFTWPDGTDSVLNAQHGTEYAWYYVHEVETHADALADAEAVEAEVGDGWIAIENVLTGTEFSFVTENDTKYIVYYKLTDRAGNTRIISSDGLITEGQPGIFDEEDGTDPEVHITEENAHQYLDNEHIHDTSVVMDLEVVEWPSVIYSGIDSDAMHYFVTDGRDEEAEPVEVSEEDEEAEGSEARITLHTSDLVEPKDDDGLIPQRNESVTITVAEGYESDQIRLTATAVDNAGNSKTVEYEDLNIDARTPTATASYDNDTVYNEKYFNDSRTATIVVQEMNFAPEYTTVTTQGSVSEWTVGEPLGMQTTNTATVTFTEDGDYTIEMETTDRAGHTMTDSFVDYGSSAAPREFVIDKTAPTVQIRFTDENGNEIPSGSYYSGTITVTITVTEHNFDDASATSGLRITRDGSPVTLPVSWSSSGDTHVATLTITEEEGAYYTFDMSFVDLANNPNTSFPQVDFYVDTMGPSVVMTEIGHNSANNGDVIAPVLTITDKYYDPSTVVVTITGVKHGELTDAYDVVDIANGQQFLFHNLEEDDIYTITVTVTDLAGNTTTLIYSELTDETTEEFTFSVNRGGSTFTTDGGTTEVLETRYVQSVDDDLVITIVNVDTLEKLVLTLTRDGVARELVDGKDYEVTMKEIPGGYEYTVTVFKSNFAEDGEYELTVYTLDRAGNESTNVISDVTGAAGGVEIKLGVDTEAPVISLDEIEKGIAYAFENYEGGSVIVTDNQSLAEVRAVLTYSDGSEVVYTWEADEIYTEPFNGTYQARLTGQRAIAQSTHRINIRVYARDKAGNEVEGPYSEGENGLYLDTEYDFYVSTNIFTRIFANKPLFFGLIGGVAVLGGGGAAAGVVLSKKKKAATGGGSSSDDKKSGDKSKKAVSAKTVKRPGAHAAK